MKLQVTLHLESRYGNDITVHDAAELHRKVEEWIHKIRLENNVQSKHVGMHFHMEVTDIFRIDHPNMVVTDDEDTYRM